MKPMFSANTEAIRREILFSDQVGAALTLGFKNLKRSQTKQELGHFPVIIHVALHCAEGLSNIATVLKSSDFISIRTALQLRRV